MNFGSIENRPKMTKNGTKNWIFQLNYSEKNYLWFLLETFLSENILCYIPSYTNPILGKPLFWSYSWKGFQKSDGITGFHWFFSCRQNCRREKRFNQFFKVLWGMPSSSIVNEVIRGNFKSFLQKDFIGIKRIRKIKRIKSIKSTKSIKTLNKKLSSS